MITLILGFAMIVGVLLFSLGGAGSAYFQWHSIIIVGGGSVAVLVLSNPPAVLKSLARAFAQMFRREEALDGYEGELRSLSENKSRATRSGHPLIRYASELWEQGVDPELFVALVSQKKREIEHKQLDAVQALKNLAKYPPALGMVGTVIGMVALFQGLDNNKDNIGANLSLAMTATFYGLILTNAVVGPLADRLHVKHVHESQLNQGVYELLLLINRGESRSFIEDELRGRAA